VIVKEEEVLRRRQKRRLLGGFHHHHLLQEEEKEEEGEEERNGEQNEDRLLRTRTTLRTSFYTRIADLNHKTSDKPPSIGCHLRKNHRRTKTNTGKRKKESSSL